MVMHALFFGSRSWTDVARIHAAIDDLLLDPTDPDQGALVVITGGARGADMLATEEMRRRGFLPIVVPAAWDVHDREGVTPVPCSCRSTADRCRAAGVRRNQLMIDAHLFPALARGDRVCARGFRSAGASPGTDDMVRRLKDAGIGGRIYHERP